MDPLLKSADAWEYFQSRMTYGWQPRLIGRFCTIYSFFSRAIAIYKPETYTRYDIYSLDTTILFNVKAVSALPGFLCIRLKIKITIWFHVKKTVLYYHVFIMNKTQFYIILKQWIGWGVALGPAESLWCMMNQPPWIREQHPQPHQWCLPAVRCV